MFYIYVICLITSHTAPPVGLPSSITAMADYITHSHPELVATTVDFPSCHVTVCSLCLSCFFLSLLCTGAGHEWAEETKQVLADWQVLQFCAKWILFSVSDFAKKTGDYRHLSATDISVLALTYMLEKQHVGVDHINTEPVRKVGSRCVFVFKGRAVDVFFLGG